MPVYKRFKCYKRDQRMDRHQHLLYIVLRRLSVFIGKNTLTKLMDAHLLRLQPLSVPARAAAHGYCHITCPSNNILLFSFKRVAKISFIWIGWSEEGGSTFASSILSKFAREDGFFGTEARGSCITSGILVHINCKPCNCECPGAIPSATKESFDLQVYELLNKNSTYLSHC